MKLTRHSFLILLPLLFTIAFGEELFFENFCKKIRGQAFSARYEKNGKYPTCTVSISIINETLAGNKQTICESISPFEVLKTVQNQDSLDCVLAQSYECFSKEDVAVSGKCFRVHNEPICPNNYRLAHIELSYTAQWLGTLFKNYGVHLLIDNESKAAVATFPYSRKEKFWYGSRYGAGVRNYKGIRTAPYKGSSPGMVEYLDQPSNSILCESTRTKKPTSIYYKDICKLFSETAGMKSFFENGFCHFITFRNFNYKTVEKTKGKYCEKIGPNVKSLLTSSNEHFDIVHRFKNEKLPSEQILLLTPLLFDLAGSGNNTDSPANHNLRMQNYRLNAEMYFEHLFSDSRTFDETSAAFYWVMKSQDRKYMHLKPYVSAPLACSYGPTRYELYNNDPLCPKNYLRFRGDGHKIKCLTTTKQASSWFDAKKECEQTSGFLAEFNSLSEIETAHDIARWKGKNESLWMGLRRVSSTSLVVTWENKLKEYNRDPNKPVVRVSNVTKILHDERFYFFDPKAKLNEECFKTDMQKQGQWSSESCQAKLRGFCSFSL